MITVMLHLCVKISHWTVRRLVRVTGVLMKCRRGSIFEWRERRESKLSRADGCHSLLFSSSLQGMCIAWLWNKIVHGACEHYFNHSITGSHYDITAYIMQWKCSYKGMTGLWHARIARTVLNGHTLNVLFSEYSWRHHAERNIISVIANSMTNKLPSQPLWGTLPVSSRSSQRLRRRLLHGRRLQFESFHRVMRESFHVLESIYLSIPSAYPHGYCLTRIFLPLDSISLLLPITANGTVIWR